MPDQPALTKGERTQRDVLDAARALFLAQGYSATGMRQIARAVGITPAAIYNHFSSKDELFTALLCGAAPFDELFALWEDAQAETPEALVERVFRGILDLFTAHQDYIRLSLIDAQERDGAALVSFLPQVFQGAMGLTRRLAALDAGQGRLRPVPPFVFLRTLVSLIAGYLLTEHVARPAQTLQLPEVDWVRELTGVFLYGVSKSAGES